MLLSFLIIQQQTEILSLNPDGVMLSNGPGDPKDVTEAIQMIQRYHRKSAIIWDWSWPSIICACMWCGYRKNEIWSSWIKLSSKRFINRKSFFNFTKSWVYVNSRNPLMKRDLAINTYALMMEQLRACSIKDYPAFSVQYDPEASPGSEDANYLFDQFIAI